jgi:chromosome transmission fidelity protein 18
MLEGEKGGVLDVGSLEFSQSSLFGGATGTVGAEAINFANSSLFQSPTVQESTELVVSKTRADASDSLFASIESNCDGDLVKDSTNKELKEAKLLNGKLIFLKTRTKYVDNDDVISGSFMNMDELFNKAELKNSMKNTKESLLELNYFKKLGNNSTQVWSEKYRPNKFIDLCSAGNDKQYRLIFQWLKRWSGAVFKDHNDSDNRIDSLGRPYKKILLVHGASGLGKTAAIHICAKQLGYNVEELNASNSMDSLPQSTNEPTNTSFALKLKIMNALTSNSISSNGKPSCLVIDEIDSAVNAREIVKVLNDLIYQDQRNTNAKNNSNNEDGTGAKSKKTKSKVKKFLLNRPIICIANDIYANTSGRFGPSPMEKLRPLCEIVQFKKPMSTTNNSGRKTSGNAMRSVKDHLMWICKQEGLKLDSRDVGEIAEICEGDLRACINHLQFNGRTITSSTLDKSSNLYKDTQLSWFSIVNMLFKRESQLSKDENFDKLLLQFMNGNGKSAVSNSSILEKVVKGCFNKYLDVVYRQDDSLVKPAEMSNWLGYHEMFNSNNHDFGQYSCLVGLKFWSLFSELNPNKHGDMEPLIENAKSIDYESFESLKMNRTIVKRILEKLPIKLKLAIGDNTEVISCLFLPYLNKLLMPELTSKVKSNLSETEKSMVEKLAGLIKGLDLTLETERDLQTGQTSLQISPNWDSVTNFESEFAPVSSIGLSKQIQIRRQELFPLLVAEFDQLTSAKATKRVIAQDTKNDEKKKKMKLGSSIDFFKQKYDGISSQIVDSSATVPTSQESRIWVKYNEGFSNAVRKTIGWNDIWLP